MTKSTPKSTAQFDARFVVKASRPRLGLPSTAVNTHSLKTFLKLSKSRKSFLIVSLPGKGFLFAWVLVKDLIMKEIYKGAKELETFAIMYVLADAVSNVARTVAAAGRWESR